MSKKAAASPRGQVKPVRTRFPATRIKKIMQSDEDVGKVAKETPVVVSRALELFVEHLLEESIGTESGVTNLTPYHIKKAVNNNDLFDFLKDTVSDAPDAPTPTASVPWLSNISWCDRGWVLMNNSEKMALDVTKYIGQTASTTVSYNRKDLILYAVGIGCTELPWVYENAPGFAAFPTYPIVLGFKGTSNDVLSFPSPAMMDTMNTPPLPGTKVGLDGERYLEVLRPLPTEGTFKLTSKVLGVHKRGKGALVENEVTLSDDNHTYVRMVSGVFLVGAKNFEPESAGTTNSENIKVPERAPDAVEETTTSPFQTHIYRLSGDYNPLHIDPKFAKISGFQEPILHGLCSLGIATRAVLKTFGGNDPNQFKSVKLRFAKPVLPGETLVTRMWKDGNKVLIEVLVKERNVVVINNAYVELKPKANL